MMKTDILCTKIQTFLFFVTKNLNTEISFCFISYMVLLARFYNVLFMLCCFLSFVLMTIIFHVFFWLLGIIAIFIHVFFFLLFFSLTFFQVEIAAEWIFTAGMIASVLQNIALSSVFRSSSSIYETFIGWCFQRLSFPCFKLSLCPNSISSYLKAEARAKFW